MQPKLPELRKQSMFSKRRVWEIKEYNREKAGFLAAELGISPLVTGILLERGFGGVDSMREFLYGGSEPFHNPYLLKDMGRAAARIRRAVSSGEKITVYGDYDVDGITASSLLYLYLKGRGANVQTYIPSRKSEGYGLNDEALKAIGESGTTLVVTVDCGISGVREVENAPAGMDIIITDHHTVPDVLPPAYAIVNAKQKDCGYPFKFLSGVGLAFKLCQALEMDGEEGLPGWAGLTELAALGTVADIVPLLGENREIVRRGLKAMETTRLEGLKALIAASSCPETGITSEHVGFILAPRLNAVGRLEHAQRAVELLVTHDAAKAAEIAAELNRENALRQEISRKIMEQAEAMLAEEKHIDTAIVLASEGWHQGVIGIVASRLVDKYHLPVILMSITGDTAKGSCRSIPALNLYEAVAAESDILIQFGGHHQAAGLTLPACRVDEFRRRFKKYVASVLRPEDYLPRQTVDCLLGDEGRITVRDLEELSLLEPCGCENQSPVFAFRGALIRSQRSMGRDRRHLQFTVDKGDCSYRAVMWGRADMLPFMFDNMVADVAFCPKVNVWNGETSVQLHGLDVRQQLAVCDLRRSTEDRRRLLEAFARTGTDIAVYASAGSMAELRELRGKLQAEAYLQLKTWKDLGAGREETAVFYDLPEIPLQEAVRRLRAAGTSCLALVYNNAADAALQQRLREICPERAQMAAAYKMVMAALGERASVPEQELLQSGRITGDMLRVFEELGFIAAANGSIIKGTIKKCSLEDSPLYSLRRQQRQKLSQIYSANMRLSQYELLRG